MVHVNSFLGCAKVETGGKVVAFVQIINYAVVLILVVVGICLGTFDDNQEKPISRNDEILPVPQPKLSPTVKTLVGLFVGASCIAIIVISFRSLNAIKTRNHTRMFEMMALMFAVTCFYMYIFLMQFWLWRIYCIPTLFVILYNFYLFIVVYSLYRVFRKEYEKEAIRQLQGNIETNV